MGPHRQPSPISLEAAEAGAALRRAAMAFYETTQQIRYCAHRAQAGLALAPSQAACLPVPGWQGSWR